MLYFYWFSTDVKCYIESLEITQNSACGAQKSFNLTQFIDIFEIHECKILHGGCQKKSLDGFLRPAAGERDFQVLSDFFVIVCDRLSKASTLSDVVG